METGYVKTHVENLDNRGGGNCNYWRCQRGFAKSRHAEPSAAGRGAGETDSSCKQLIQQQQLELVIEQLQQLIQQQQLELIFKQFEQLQLELFVQQLKQLQLELILELRRAMVEEEAALG
jgi:hypothetical protein